MGCKSNIIVRGTDYYFAVPITKELIKQLKTLRGTLIALETGHPTWTRMRLKVEFSQGNLFRNSKESDAYLLRQNYRLCGDSLVFPPEHPLRIKYMKIDNNFVTFHCENEHSAPVPISAIV